MNEIMDFSKVVLREEELRCLYALQVEGSVFIMPPQLSSYMSTLGFISLSPKFSDGQHFVLAGNGERYLKYLADKKRKEDEEKQEKKRFFDKENHREWIGIILSTLVAVASLAISAITLWRQA